MHRVCTLNDNNIIMKIRKGNGCVLDQQTCGYGI